MKTKFETMSTAIQLGNQLVANLVELGMRSPIEPRLTGLEMSYLLQQVDDTFDEGQERWGEQPLPPLFCNYEFINQMTWNEASYSVPQLQHLRDKWSQK